MPVAVSQPKKAEPTLMPPNCSFSRATTVSRVGISPGGFGAGRSSRSAAGRRYFSGWLRVCAVLAGVVDVGLAAEGRVPVTGVAGRSVFGACCAAHGAARFH